MLAAILLSQEQEVLPPTPVPIVVLAEARAIRVESFTQRIFYKGTLVATRIWPYSASLTASLQPVYRTEPFWTESKTFMAHGRTVSRVYQLTMLFKLYLDFENALED